MADSAPESPAPAPAAEPAAPVAEAPAPPAPEAPAAPVERNEAEFVPVRTMEDRVPVGSIFTRTPFGWSVKIMYGGSLRLAGDGVTMDHALTDAGV